MYISIYMHPQFNRSSTFLAYSHCYSRSDLYKQLLTEHSRDSDIYKLVRIIMYPTWSFLHHWAGLKVNQISNKLVSDHRCTMQCSAARKCMCSNFNDHMIIGRDFTRYIPHKPNVRLPVWPSIVSRTLKGLESRYFWTAFWFFDAYLCICPSY
jgi:hypothetical protein